MNTQKPHVWRRIIIVAAASLTLWAAAVGALAWYLPRMVAEDIRTGTRTSTDGDAIAIPLFGVAILFAGVLLLANVLVAAFLLWRQHARARSASLPAA